MAMDSMSSKMVKFAKQRALFTTLLVLMVLVVATFVVLRFWILKEFSSGDTDSLRLFDNIFFIVFVVVMLIVTILGYVAARLYTTLRETSSRAELEHKMAMEQEQEKIRIKRQLTNNINHELKTPICSILGYLEMILGNGNLEQTTMRSFVQKSYDQAERLRSLMADLSTIAHIEEASVMIERESVDIVKLVADIVDDTFPQAEQNRIVVVNRVEGDVVVNGNQKLLYSIFRNLIDNAIAYSGGRQIFVDIVANSSSECRFTIVDNGIGVEAKHLPYLFERFYRVDKGRSRKVGGTGLGLSIVKNAVVFHGGNIIAKTARSGGLEFAFSLCK